MLHRPAQRLTTTRSAEVPVAALKKKMGLVELGRQQGLSTLLSKSARAVVRYGTTMCASAVFQRRT